MQHVLKTKKLKAFSLATDGGSQRVIFSSKQELGLENYLQC